MRYITVEKDIITGIYTGGQLPKGAIKITEKAQYVKGSNIGEYDKDGVKLLLSQLVEKDFIKLQPTQKLEGEKVVSKTEVELIEDGLKEKPKGQKIIEGQLVAMTIKEQFEAKEITEAEYSELIRQERDNIITQIENSKEYKRALRLYRNGDSMALSAFDEKIEALLNIPQIKGFPKTFTDFEEFEP